MSHDYSHNRKQQNCEYGVEEPTSPDETYETNMPYVKVQDEIEYQFLLHWKNLCEENVQDINKEIELICQGEKRLVELTKKDSDVYPRYRAKKKQLQNCKRDVGSLAKKFQNCIQRDCNVFIPLSSQECFNKLYCYLKKRFRKTKKHAKLDLNADIRRRFGSFFEKHAFSDMKRKYFRKYFRKLGIETENLTPALIARDRVKTIKIVIYDCIFAFKHMLGVPVLSRINEVPEILRPRSSLSLLTRSRRLSTNILRKTYNVSKSGLIYKPDGDLTNTGRHSEKSPASNSFEVNRHPSKIITDYFVNRKLTPYESFAQSVEDSDPCLQKEISITKNIYRFSSSQDDAYCKQKVPAETLNDEQCIVKRQTETECSFDQVSIVDTTHCKISVGQTEPICPGQSDPISRDNSFAQKESFRLENSCNTKFVAVDCNSQPNELNKPKIKVPQGESTILENPCSLTSYPVNTSNLLSNNQPRTS